jgi:hypothetical protein
VKKLALQIEMRLRTGRQRAREWRKKARINEVA